MQQRKKVLFTSHVANFAKFNQPFMRWLKQRCYEIHYASLGEEEIEGVDKHFTIPFERSPFKLNNLRALKQLKRIIDNGNYDLIHTHTPMGSVITRLAARDARKSGTRVVYTAHGFHFFDGAPLLNWALYYPIERIMARFTDTLITINREDFERANNQFKTNVEYVPGVGVDPDRFTNMTAARKAKYRQVLGIKPSDFVMIYAAELSKRKRQQWLIRTLKDMMQANSSYHLLLAGSDSLDGACQKLVQKYKLENNIHFLGYRTDIPNLMMISDIAVSASSQEGLPVNIMEAMYVGLPIVATDCRGNRDLVIDGSNGYLVDQKDSSTFARRVHGLAAHGEHRAAKARASQQLIAPYLMSVVMPQMVAIYREAGMSGDVVLSSTEKVYGK